jgi:hypothetical protein
LRLILSTDDLTAQEFLGLFRGSFKGKGPRGEGDLRYVEGADHTFTQGAWKERVAALSAEAWGALGTGKAA